MVELKFFGSDNLLLNPVLMGSYIARSSILASGGGGVVGVGVGVTGGSSFDPLIDRAVLLLFRSMHELISSRQTSDRAAFVIDTV